MTYTVKAGDTLYGISNQFGVSVTDLASKNGVNANTLQIGQVLEIPEYSGSNPNNMFYYTVVEGDTLWSIAKKYNTTVPAILDLNYLTSTSLQVGQVLRIPEMYTPVEEITLPQYINYVVKKGDTLYSIAKEFNISVDTLKKDNSMISDSLQPGQNLKIRTYQEEVEECFGEEYDIPVLEEYSSYTVLKGDSLYSIAKKYQTSVANIMSLNNLSNSYLSIGQVLRVPKIENTNTYIVQKGDTLWSIAKKFQTTVDSIIQTNNLSTSNLSIGQVLQIKGGY